MNCLLQISVTCCIFFSLVPAISRAEPVPSQETIRSVQNKLNSYGYSNGTADGKIGPKTVKALRLFQEESELPVTGKIDKLTVAELGVDGSFEEVMASRPVPETHIARQQAEPQKTDQSPSLVTQSGNLMQTVGGTLTQIGEDNSGSWIGGGFSLAGKIYTSVGDNITAVGENKKSIGEAHGDFVEDATSAIAE